MNNQKGTRWIADQIMAAFEASRGGLVSADGRMSQVDVDGVVSLALEEALERLGGEEPSPPAPLPQAGEG